MKTKLTIDSQKTDAPLHNDTPGFTASETLIRDHKRLRVRSGLRAGAGGDKVKYL